MSGDKSGYNAPKDVRKTQRDRRDDVFGRSDAEKCDVKKQGDREQGAVKSPRVKDAREHSVRNDSSSSSRKQRWKSSKGRGASESRLVPRTTGVIWEPGPSGHGRSSGASSRRHSFGSSCMQSQVSEADVTPSHGMVRRADTHTGGVLHVDLATRQPKRAVSEGGSGRHVVRKREEDGEGEDLRRLSDLEERLSGSLARWNGQPARFDRVQDICFQLQAETRHCLQAQGLLVFLKKELCGRLWRAGHYPVVEGLRKALSQAASSEDKEALRDTYLRFLSMASSFYQEEMSGLQRRLEFTLPKLLDPTRKHSSQVLCAKILCHQLYLVLGDLARYAEQASEKPDWSKPKNYYTTAQELMPKNGKTYNQLAVVAISAQRRLDAVYYYIRGLSAGNPFLGARESLLGLLHDTGSKVEPPKKKKGGGLGGVTSPLRQDVKKKVDSTKKDGGRKETREVWVFPTRTLEDVKKMMMAEDLPREVERKLGVEDTNQHSDSLPKLVDAAPSSELSKNIVKLFLAVHAKMYTKIGYDTLRQAVTSFLSSWAEFLAHRLTHSDTVLSIKMAVINFFSVHNASGDGYCLGRLHLMGVALRFVLEVTAVAVRCCLSRLAGVTSPSSRSAVPLGQWEEANSLEGLSAEAKASLLEVGHLLVPVKVSFDWLACQSSLWGECAAEVDPSVWLQFWSHSTDLLNKLRALLPHKTLTQDAANLTQVALYEDRHLQGFTPLAKALGPAAYTTRNPTEEEFLLQCLKRVSCLLTKARELTDRACTPGVQHYLEFSTTEQRFNCSSKKSEDNEEKEKEEEKEEEEADGEEEDEKKARASSSEEDEEKGEKGEEEEEEGEADGSEGGTPGSTPPSSPVDGNLDLLRAEREELAKEMWEKEKAKERVKDYLAVQAVEGRGKVFVFPKYLIPDTNEFIDHLPQLIQLVTCGHFVVTVPLTVIEELEGIAKGSSVGAQGKHEHSSSATQGAKEALSLLRGWFSSKSPSVRAITVRGELLTAMDYATMERMGGTVTTNDDFILASCSSVNSRTSKASSHSTNVMCVVVLLTADRNLRVKAHAAGVPVRDFPSFMAWVKPALKLKEIK